MTANAQKLHVSATTPSSINLINLNTFLTNQKLMDFTRCSDPTEMGTRLGGLCNPDYPEKVFLPTKPLEVFERKITDFIFIRSVINLNLNLLPVRKLSQHEKIIHMRRVTRSYHFVINKFPPFTGRRRPMDLSRTARC